MTIMGVSGDHPDLQGALIKCYQDPYGCSSFNPCSAEFFLPFPENFGDQQHIARNSSCLSGLVGVKSLFSQDFR